MNGRIVCTKDSPYTYTRDYPGARWAHPDAREKREDDGFVTYECPNCGKSFTVELPQRPCHANVITMVASRKFGSVPRLRANNTDAVNARAQSSPAKSTSVSRCWTTACSTHSRRASAAQACVSR